MTLWFVVPFSFAVDLDLIKKDELSYFYWVQGLIDPPSLESNQTNKYTDSRTFSLNTTMTPINSAKTMVLLALRFVVLIVGPFREIPQ